ncbi:MAG: TIGR01212 family radical SAM protein [Ruminococcus sp.]|nr:TIGR01212 family radical SAM protein [Ruminococcus sp.]
MRHYYSLNEYYQQKFGKKVYKLSISAGLSCPNRDGTLATGGCIFCSRGGSGEFAASSSLSIAEQLEQAKRRIASKTRDNAYIAYFQPFTNTYGEIDYLRKIYFEAIAPEEIVGLSIATRPDCLPDEVLELLTEINEIKPVTVELGLQTIHPATAAYIRRGYDLCVYDEAVKKLHSIGIEVVTHLILGLPGESADMMIESVRYAGRVSDGIKLQLLHVLKDTDLADAYAAGKIEVLSLDEYTDVLCRAIEVLPPNVVIHRLTGDGDKRSLIAPLWSADKKRVLNHIKKALDDREIIQGNKA